MPPRSPLPPQRGLHAAWVRTPDRDASRPAPYATMGEFLRARLPARADVDAGLAAGRFVDAAGRPWRDDDPYRPHTFVWFHRTLRPEVPVPFEVRVLYRDDRIVVADKPGFLATIPRGAHVRETAVVRLREALGLPDLVPAHRLDRLTAGVLLLVADPAYRGAYAALFAEGRVHKTYEAIAPTVAALARPVRLQHRLVKPRGSLQTLVEPGEPNALVDVEPVETRGAWTRYRLRPRTGRTHQLRVQLAAVGAPILGDPWYPEVLDVSPTDYHTPLRLVARELAFDDPVDGTPRRYVSRATLTWPDDGRG